MLCVVPDSAADDVYGDYIDRFVGGQLFRRGMRRGGRVEVMSPGLRVGEIAGKIRLSWLSAFIGLSCRYAYTAVRVEAAGSAI